MNINPKIKDRRLAMTLVDEVLKAYNDLGDIEALANHFFAVDFLNDKNEAGATMAAFCIIEREARRIRNILVGLEHSIKQLEDAYQ